MNPGRRRDSRGSAGIAAALALVVCVAGCGDGRGGLPDAGLMLRDAAVSLRSAHSAHIALDVQGAVPGLALQRLDADVSTRAGGTATGTATAFGRAVDVVESGGRLYTRRPDGSLFPVPADAGVPDPAAMVGPDGALARLLGRLRNPKTVARADFQGVDAFEVTAEVPAAALAGLLPADRADATLTLWLRVRGAHVPLHTAIGFPDGRVEVGVSNVNAPARDAKGDL